MTLRFAFSMDEHDTTNYYVEAFDDTDQGVNTLNEVDGAFPGHKGVQLANEITPCLRKYFTPTLGQGGENVYVHGWFKIQPADQPIDNLAHKIIGFGGTDDYDTSHNIGIGLNSDRTITVYRDPDGGGETSLGSSTNAFALDRWYWVGVRVKLDNTTGEVEVQVDGTNSGWINLTSQDTVAYDAECHEVFWTGLDGLSRGVDWDDFFVHSGTGSGTFGDNFLSRMRLQRLGPNGDGDNQDSVATGSVNRWQNVDQTNTSAGSVYNTLSTANEYDLYTVASPPSGNIGPIYGVIADNASSVDGVTARGLEPMIKVSTSGTEGRGTPIDALVTGEYAHRQSLFETVPGTTNAFVSTNLDELQVGVELSS